ncbi:MAG: hypothetical protein ACKVZH_11700 [Blastocatellia bacterium]
MFGAVTVKLKTTNRLEQAYQLAYFILGNQEIAEQIAVDAVDRLQLAVVTQDRRYYYIPQGSSRQLGHTSGTRSKVNFSELHLLQRLIFDETESYEKEQEQSGFDDRRLLIHFLKHLVRITVKRNSFYVSLGVTRLLHRYSITEAIATHGVVMQDPNRAKDNYYWRSRKAQLMQEVKSRFGDLLQLTRGAYGEERFSPRPDQARYADFVTHCLQQFMPWETECPLPPGACPADGRIPALEFNGDDPDEEHRTEVARMHAVLHPTCFERLLAELKFDSPAIRLDLPEFFHTENHVSKGAETGFQMTEPDEMKSHTMHTTLEERQLRRRQTQRTPGNLKILVDRQPRATLNLEANNQIEFRFLEGEEFIEIRPAEEPDLCLALYPIDYTMLQQLHSPKNFVIELAGGQQLNFTLTPERDADGELTGTAVSVNYQVRKLARLRSLWTAQNWFPALQPVWRLALPVTLLLVASIGGFAVWQALKSETSPSVAINSGNDATDNQPAPPTGGNGSNLGALPGTTPQKPSKPSSNLRDHDVEGDSTPTVNSPSETRRVFLSVNREASEFRGELTKRLTQAGLWELTGKEDADTALDITLSADGKTALARLLNARGKVIWPASGKSQRYAGSAGQISESIVADLKSAARQ